MEVMLEKFKQYWNSEAGTQIHVEKMFYLTYRENKQTLRKQSGTKVNKILFLNTAPLQDC